MRYLLLFLVCFLCWFGVKAAPPVYTFSRGGDCNLKIERGAQLTNSMNLQDLTWREPKFRDQIEVRDYSTSFSLRNEQIANYAADQVDSLIAQLTVWKDSCLLEGGGATDLNFAENNLIYDADRSHTSTGYTTTITDGTNEWFRMDSTDNVQSKFDPSIMMGYDADVEYHFDQLLDGIADMEVNFSGLIQKHTATRYGWVGVPTARVIPFGEPHIRVPSLYSRNGTEYAIFGTVDASDIGQAQGARPSMAYGIYQGASTPPTLWYWTISDGTGTSDLGNPQIIYDNSQTDLDTLEIDFSPLDGHATDHVKWTTQTSSGTVGYLEQHFFNSDQTTTTALNHTLNHDVTMDRGNFTISYADNGASADLYGGTYANGTQTFGYAIQNDLGHFATSLGMFNSVGGTTSQVIADSNNVTLYTTDGDVIFQRDASNELTWDMDDIAGSYVYSIMQQSGKVGQSIISFTPASEGDTNHEQGTVAYDATYLYFKVTDTNEGGSHLWKRIAWGAGGW